MPEGPAPAPAPDLPPRPTRDSRTAIIVTTVLALTAVAFLALVVYIVVTVRSSPGATSNASSRPAFESAMRKAGVDAAYPGSPVDITAVTAEGSHPFSATFTAEEIAALLNAFRFESDSAGTRIMMERVRADIPAAGTGHLKAAVSVNGATYSGSVTLPLTFENGRVRSPGVTELTVEGIPANDGQKGQVGGALVEYSNAFLAAAPRLTVQSAAITPEGVAVTGVAPDSLSYP